MKKKLTFYALVFTSVTFVLSNGDWFFQKRPCHQFQQIERYREVQEIFDICDKQTLITFDIDDTLITSVDAMAARDGLYPIWFTLGIAFKYPLLIVSQEKRDWVVSIMNQQAEHFVFDSDIARYIQQLRGRGCNVIALTWMKSGSMGLIKNMPEWRAHLLRSFGIDLQGQFQDTVFTKLPKYRDNYSCLYKGILCTNRLPKGDVLGAFLDYCHLKPARIISFDDSVHFLDSIAHECARRKITFTGYQVLGAKKLAGAWNSRRAFLQFDYVMKHAQWLSDKQADVLLAEKSVA